VFRDAIISFIKLCKNAGLAQSFEHEPDPGWRRSERSQARAQLVASPPRKRLISPDLTHFTWVFFAKPVGLCFNRPNFLK